MVKSNRDLQEVNHYTIVGYNRSYPRSRLAQDERRGNPLAPKCVTIDTQEAITLLTRLREPDEEGHFGLVHEERVEIIWNNKAGMNDEKVEKFLPGS